MGLFSFLNKRTKQIEDDVFGLITFRPYKLLDLDYFVGSTYFEPTQQDIDLYINADHTGPTQAQRDFFKQVEKNYRTYIDKAIPKLLEAFNDKGQPIQIKNFDEEFTPVCLVIPVMNNDNPAEWKLEFSTTHDDLNHYTVEFAGDNATGIIIDEE